MSNPYFPPDLFIEILLKLPAKSLLRFTVVCKSWHLLITSTSFTSAHLKSQKDNNNNTLLLRRYNKTTRKEFYSLVDEKNQIFSLNNSSELNFPFISHLGYFRIVGSCNGVVCLSDDLFGDLRTIILWNPSIQKFRRVPLPLIHPNWAHMFVLGFADYKLVRIVFHKGEDLVYPPVNTPPEVEIYTVDTGVWRRLKGAVVKHYMVDFMWSQAFLNGGIHWIAYNTSEDRSFRSLVMVFDVAEEVFRLIMLPDGIAGEVASNLSVSEFGGSLAVIKNDMEIDGGSCEVWVMKRYGDMKSWTKLYSIDLVEGMEKLVRFRNNGEILFSTANYELVSYDPNSGVIKNLGIHGSPRSFCVQDYMESLVLIHEQNVNMEQILDGMRSLWF